VMMVISQSWMILEIFVQISGFLKEILVKDFKISLIQLRV